MSGIKQVQLGKNRITENFLSQLKKHFEKAQTVKISVLKNACRDRKELKEMTEDLLDKLGKNYTARVIGYTINIKKWRKDKR